MDLDPFRAYLNSIGDSLVIGEDDESFKVHVHTDIPGAALTEGQKYGTLELAKIENMRTQYEDMAAGRTPQSTDDLDMVEAALEGKADSKDEERWFAPAEKKFGVVAVCAGTGYGLRVSGPGGGRDHLWRADHEPRHRGHSPGD